MDKKQLITADGRIFKGEGFGADTEALFPCVVQTSMVGYQEIITDPVNTELGILFTYPLIGNYGLTDEDFENRTPQIKALICRDYNDEPSNFRATQSLSEYLEENHIPGITGVDTRALQQHLRALGDDRVLLCGCELTAAEAVERIQAYTEPEDLVAQVSVRKKRSLRACDFTYTVAVLDLGGKKSLLENFQALGCNLNIYPYKTPAHTILEDQPDGLLITDGPGNPEALRALIPELKTLVGQLPIMAVGLGCQLLALSDGASGFRLSQGQFGANHALHCLSSDKLHIRSLAQRFAIAEESLGATRFEVEYKDVQSGLIEGIVSESLHVLGLCFTPELPQRNELHNEYRRFCSWMEEN